ncbi:hypothetical protein IA929_07700 [Listeria seeligeri]|uniref:hypothetical protein n=1 Tax=Listeria seeligeri TaxID=1640 RepID=UPI001887C44D|nr:hypothetical protein [Listeria seeligeri]MBF2599890.1 hypothetical protein [Listeria seeligeri]
MKVKDNTNFYLADAVYANKYLKTGSVLPLENNEEWVTINSVNKDNGLQAIAVVPIKDYKDYNNGKLKTYNHIVFVSRGSEELDDWNENLGLVAKMRQVENYMQDYEEWEKMQSQRLRSQLDEETWEGGKYSELTSWDVDDVLTEVSRKYKDGVYRFHNTDKFEEFYDENRKTIQKLNGFKEEVISAALAFNDKDKELGNWIKENSKGW